MNNEISVSVVGLGYVGLPVAIEMSKKFPVIGFDIDEVRIKELNSGTDRTCEVPSSELIESEAIFTCDPAELGACNFHIVAVPTPIDDYKVPNMSALKGASETVGKILKKEDIVVFESTVFPGATEDICLPILERLSGLKSDRDFKVGYSPERINPGDSERGFANITKVVSGQDEECLKVISHVYGQVVHAGVFEASSIKVAEAAKIIENTQRDVNIALMNEFSMIFSKLDLNIGEVLQAAATKWNFLPFKPGLVGGHCIGVDPYYLTYKAKFLGHNPELILAGRRINDNMSKFYAEKIVKTLVKKGHPLAGSSINLFGITFKENCPDLRNTKVIDLIRELKEYGLSVNITDACASKQEATDIYGIDLISVEDLPHSAASVIAVPHSEYLDFDLAAFRSNLVFDLKNVYMGKELGIEIVSL